MTISIILFILCALGFLFFFRMSSHNRENNLNSLNRDRQEIEAKYEFMRNQRRELKQELTQKQDELTKLRTNPEGIKTFTADELGLDDTDESEKISRYLLSQGKMSLEQHQKVLQKMETLKLDYIGVCMALGFIDLETAQKALKTNKIRPRATKAT